MGVYHRDVCLVVVTILGGGWWGERERERMARESKLKKTRR